MYNYYTNCNYNLPIRIIKEGVYHHVRIGFNIPIGSKRTAKVKFYKTLSKGIPNIIYIINSFLLSSESHQL